MNREALELWAFLRQIEKTPRDTQLRQVFADWLDEHDAPEEAETQRNFSFERYDAEKYVQFFCERYSADYDELLESLNSGNGYCFGDDDGPNAVTSDYRFKECVEILLEKEVDVEAQPFRCAC